MKKLLGLTLVSVLFSGCATNHMAFDRTAKSINTTSQSVLLMTLDVSRSDDSRYTPNPKVITFEAFNAQDKSDHVTFQLNKADDAVRVAGHDIYLTRLALHPGQYLIKDITGSAIGIPFFANFAIPLRMHVDVKPNTVTYVGRVSAKLRPRHDDEFRAGPLLPLVDQAVSGMSGSTWDVVVEDKSQQDMPLFQSTYPVVIDATIDTKILPRFDRASVQQWSEENPKYF